MRTILLPTDFSENARNAMVYAINLFGENENYLLFHSYFVNFKKSTMFVNIVDTLKKESEEELNKDMDFIKVTFPDLNLSLKTYVTGGEITDEINAFGRNEPLDFVVMGTKGASGIKEVLIGSNAANVFGKVKYPVITVPEDTVFSNLKTVVFASDYEHINKNVALDPLLRLADDNHSKIMVVHATNDISDADAEVERLNLTSLFLESQTSFHVVKGDDIEESINSFASDHSADLLVMLARGGSFLHKLFHPSVSKRVAFHCKVPVLVLHDNK